MEKYTAPYIYPLDSMKFEQDKLLAAGKITNEEYKINCSLIPQRALAIKKWHVAYRFEHPNTLIKKRIKVYADELNRQHPENKISFAMRLRDATSAALLLGYDPFDEMEKARIRKEKRQAEKAKIESGDRAGFTIIHALNYFLDEKKREGKDPSTISRYKTGINFFKDWLNTRKMLLTRAGEITSTQILTYLREKNDAEKWGNKTYNNHLGTLQTCFNLLSTRIHSVIPFNPIEGATLKDTLAKKHTAYTDQQLSHVLTQVRNAKDAFMEGLILTVYYACIRSKDEIRAFKIKHILFDRDLIRLDAEDTKNKTDEFIPLDPELKDFYLRKGYDQLPGDWFVFGKHTTPGPLKATSNQYSTLFRVYRDFCNLDDRYTLYGFKHTRVIHLALAGVSPYDLMELLRHSSLDMLMNYLRDLGVTIRGGATKDSKKI